jgi:hypothetical protein
MQKGTTDTHYKPVDELKTAKVLVRFNAAQMAQVKAAAAKDGQAVAPWIAARVLASINSSNTPQEDTAQATPAPEQAHSAPSQTDQATANKPSPTPTKAKTTTRKRKTSTADAAAKPAPKSSSTPRRKTTTRRASTSRRKVVPEEHSAA